MALLEIFWEETFGQILPVPVPMFRAVDEQHAPIPQFFRGQNRGALAPFHQLFDLLVGQLPVFDRAHHLLTLPFQRLFRVGQDQLLGGAD